MEVQQQVEENRMSWMTSGLLESLEAVSRCLYGFLSLRLSAGSLYTSSMSRPYMSYTRSVQSTSLQKNSVTANTGKHKKPEHRDSRLCLHQHSLITVPFLRTKWEARALLGHDRHVVISRSQILRPRESVRTERDA